MTYQYFFAHTNLLLHYNKIMECCCFSKIAFDCDNIGFWIQQTFDKVLDDQYKIDSEGLVDFFNDYRVWLLRRYMMPYYTFPSIYPSLYRMKHRFRRDTSAFIKMFGRSNTKFFFAQTFYDFSTEALKSKDSGTITARKMRLGAIKMLSLADYFYNDSAYELEKSVIDKRQRGKEK